MTIGLLVANYQAYYFMMGVDNETMPTTIKAAQLAEDIHGNDGIHCTLWIVY